MRDVVRRAFLGGILIAGWLCDARASMACPWDDETYWAEAESLPCVFDAVLGTYPKHSREFHLARLRAATGVLDREAANLDALDMKAVALLKLGRLKDAEPVMLERRRLAPDAYASHANLGTLYTFTGEWSKALEAIDKALTIEPKAHFGREKYHFQLVVFLRDVRDDPSLAERENFLRIAVDARDRLAGSKEVFARAGGDDAMFDALVSMISVYGADRVSHVYFALGEILALRGMTRLAWTAYQRAVELKHPRAKEIREWQKRLSLAMKADYDKDPKAWAEKAQEYAGLPLPYRKTHPEVPFRDIYEPISATYSRITRDIDPEWAHYRRNAEKFTAWERTEIAGGLPVWSEEGLAKIYARANELRPRCKSPGVVLNEATGQ